MKAKDIMITQAITQWLRKLFAWWPWLRHPEDDYVQTVSTLNTNTTQEATVRTTVDGASYLPPGITSVAIEQIGEETPSETNRPGTDPSMPSTLSPQPGEEKNNTPDTPRSIHPPIVPSSIAQESGRKRGVPEQAPRPTAQQRLEFLRYLVQRGIISEYFKEGQVPDQHQKE